MRPPRHHRRSRSLSPPEPAPKPEPAAAPAQDAKASVTPPSAKAPPFQVEPDPAPAPKPPQSASARQARKTPPPGAPYMDGHAEFLSERDTSKRDDDMVRLQEEARRQGRPGGQVPLSEMKPDPRPQQEFVNFTLAGNGRIKRC